MATRHDLDDDPPVLNPLHRLVAGVDPELLTDRLLYRDLPPFPYSTDHDMNVHSW